MSTIQGFFTDPTICIGCKACEVACKEWNQIPEDGLEWSGLSYDHTRSLGHSSWRHVKFVEQDRASGRQLTPQTMRELLPPHLASALEPAHGGCCGSDPAEAALNTLLHGSPCGGSQGCSCGPKPTAGAPPTQPQRSPCGGSHAPSAGPALVGGSTDNASPFRWIFLSDVCKHCEHAGCLEACPTGSIVRTEVGSVLVQEDICNGCGYCVVTCPFGVIDRRPTDGRAFKCTFCYDRQRSGLEPACATACPTQSIRFGPLDELHAYAQERLRTLHARGYTDARLYTGEPLPASTGPTDTSSGQHAGLAPQGAQSPGSVGHLRAFSLTLGEPEAYNLPRRPEVPTVHLRASWTAAIATSVAMLAISAVVAYRKDPQA